MRSTKTDENVAEQLPNDRRRTCGKKPLLIASSTQRTHALVQTLGGLQQFKLLPKMQEQYKISKR